jgi:hypothetical protein
MPYKEVDLVLTNRDLPSLPPCLFEVYHAGPSEAV